jgi:hypothetical protein
MSGILDVVNKPWNICWQLFQHLYCAPCIILYYDQQMHNYLTNYHTATCFDTTVSSSGSLWSVPCQDTQVFQMQLLVPRADNFPTFMCRLFNKFWELAPPKAQGLSRPEQGLFCLYVVNVYHKVSNITWVRLGNQTETWRYLNSLKIHTCFRLPPLCKWGLCSSRTLRIVD